MSKRRREPTSAEVAILARAILTAIASSETGDSSYEKTVFGRAISADNWATTNEAIGLICRSFAHRLAALENLDTATVLEDVAASLDEV